MKRKRTADIEFHNKIKRLTLVAMVSDDYLLERLVLKGGNAIDLIYKLSHRASVDLDFSMEGEFTEEELPGIEERIKKSLERTFEAEGHVVFDLDFSEKPEKVSDGLKTYWGGYRVEFKVIEKDQYEKYSGNIEVLRRNARTIDPGQTRKYQIDISKFEYCRHKRQEEVEGYAVHVYTPEMLVCEKVRAICQQMEEYKEIVTTHARRPRPRDFFDIHTIMTAYPFDVHTEENKDLLKRVFIVKKVPLSFVGRLHETRDYHRQGVKALEDTLTADVKQRDFDFYFDFVVERFRGIEF